MKNLYTSNYDLNGKNPNAIGISFILPSWFSGKEMAKLAPTLSMITRFKSWIQEGKYGEAEYEYDYINLLKERGVTPQGLVDELPDGAILLCYEYPEEFCHRHVLAHWIQENTDVIVTEAKSYRDIKKDNRDKVVDSFIDF
jgi:hypothetical protein